MVMSQPVKLSDTLVLDARQIAGPMNRSIAGQIEHWAQIGKALEPILQGRQAAALAAAGATVPLSECVKIVGTTEGTARLREYLKRRPFPHYEAAPGGGGLLVRTEADGKKTVGRFINRKFTAVAPNHR